MPGAAAARRVKEPEADGTTSVMREESRACESDISAWTTVDCSRRGDEKGLFSFDRLDTPELCMRQRRTLSSHHEYLPPEEPLKEMVGCAGTLCGPRKNKPTSRPDIVRHDVARNLLRTAWAWSGTS